MADDIMAVDVMNYLFTAESSKRDWEDSYEFNIVARTIFGAPGMHRPGFSAKEYVALMDDAGYDKVFIPAVKMWSHWNKDFVWNITTEEIQEQVKQFPDRLVGIAGYNPYRISESITDVRRAVKELGFKGVYIHCYGYNIPYDGPQWYPLYETCVELGVPVSMQLGHSLEIMPSEYGRPLALDRIALDFPDLTIIGSHTGWPWCEEMVAMAWKHANVYVDISAHMPKYLDSILMYNMNTRLRRKTLFGTNGMDIKGYKAQFMELKLKDETKQLVLRDNAIRVFKL